MNSKLKFTIKKRSQPGWLTWLIVVFPFLFGLLNDFLGLPWAIRYVLDMAWCALLIYMLCYNRHFQFKPIRGILSLVILFFAYTVAVYLVEFQSPLYYLWGFRNNFRVYVALFAFALFLSSRDIEDFLSWFDKIFWINVVVSLLQFFVWGYKGDRLGGIFGTETGANGYTHLYFTIVITKSVLSYLQKQESTWNCVSKCSAAMLVAALAELKFFIAEFALILVLALLFTDFTWRKLWVIIGGTVAFIGCVALLGVVFPGFKGFFSIERLYEYAASKQGYTGYGDLNRLNAIPQINEQWLTGWSQRLFGFGLGNCDTSNFALVNTPFYKTYGHMHYNWFSYAFMYLECGWIGLVFYFSFFVMTYAKAMKASKRALGKEKVYCMLASIMAICCMLTSIYNGSLRTEMGYMAYFVLSFPYILEREKNSKRRREHLAEKFAAEHCVP